jgi:hypothetical protein
MSTIEVAREFSRTPGGRFHSLGPASGEAFRDFLLQRLSETDDTIEVVIDGVDGYGSSFLEEAFGGLYRQTKLSSADIKRRVVVVARTPAFQTYVDEARGYMEEAAKRRAENS